MQDRSTATLPEIASHPDWCIGGNHEPLIPAESVGDDREHFAIVANGVGWAIEITEPVVGYKRTEIHVRVGPDSCAVEASLARSLAAAITRAADLIESDGCR